MSKHKTGSSKLSPDVLSQRKLVLETWRKLNEEFFAGLMMTEERAVELRALHEKFLNSLRKRYKKDVVVR